MTIKFKRLSDSAIAPVKAHSTDAGFDLTCSRITTEVNECGQVIIVYHTDIALEIPEGYFAALVPRSSIAKKSITLTNCFGVLDSCYRGEIMAKMRATTDVIPAVYKEGERFAQILILPVPDVQFEESEELSTTERGEGGYGSSDETTNSAAITNQSLPENKVETINSENVEEQAAEVTETSEQA